MFNLAFPWFSSDASRMAVWGGLAALIAAFATWCENRRIKRSDLDRVGWMPWTSIFMVSLLAALILLGLAVREWFNPA